MDSRTIVVVSCLVYVLLAAGVAVMGVPLRRYRGPRHWTAGLCGWSLGAFLVSLQGVLPPWLTIIVGNGALIGSTCVVAEGLALFMGAPSRRRLHLIVTVAALASLTHLTLVQPSFVGRVMTFSLACFVVAVDIGLVLARHRGLESSVSRRFLIVVWTVLAGTQLLRLVLIAAVDTSQPALFRNDWLTVASVLGLMLEVLALVSGLMALAASRFAGELEADRAHLAATNDQLRAALDNVRVLSGLLPLCAWCKRIKIDAVTWEPLDAYVQQRSGASFTHGICPDCAAKVRAQT